MPRDPYDDPDDPDVLFHLSDRDREDWDLEIGRWEAWRASIEDAVGQRSGVIRADLTHRPAWYDRRDRGSRDPVREFGWFGDHEWAETWWPDPKYL